MAADNILGKILIEGANQAANIAGGNPSLGSGLAGGGGGTGTRSAERETRSFQKTVKDAQIKSVAFAKNQPQWWTRMFKTLGIQMGLAGILKQSQVFTSTVGAFFQIFGAMVDVMLAPLVKPVLIPVMRWLARQIPTMGKLSRAILGFAGNTIMGIVRVVKKIGGWISDLATASFWGTAFKGVVDAIGGVARIVISEFKRLIGWNYWAEIFRSLWNRTVGGKGIGMGINIPAWGGASTAKHTPPTAEQRQRSTDFDAGASEGIDGYDIRTDAVTGPTRVTKADETPTAVILQLDKDKDNEKSLLDKAKEKLGKLTDLFMGLDATLRNSLTALGIVAAPATLARLTTNASGAAAKVINRGFAPSRVAYGLIRGVAQQINPFAAESFIGQVLKNKSITKGFGAAAGNWKDELVKELNLKGFRGGSNPNATLKAGRNLADEAIEAIPNMTTRGGYPVVNNANDMAPKYSAKSSKLAKARHLLSKLTTWLGQQLRNLKTLILNPRILEQAKNNLKTKVDEIVNLLKTVTGTEAQNIIARARFLGRFLGRVAPIVGAGIAALETGFNVKRILGSELPWFGDANTEVEATAALKKLQEIEDMGLGKATHSWSSPMGIGKNLINLGFGKELKGNLVGATSQELWAQNTKGGAILSQLLMGTLSTGTGAVGAPGIPLSVGMGISQLMMTEQALGNSANNQAFQASLQQLNDNLALGLQSTQKQINMTMEGNPVILDVYS